MRQVKTTSGVNLARGTALVLLIPLMSAAGVALASPLVDTRIGGLALVGPSSAHLASAWYNPAALDLSPGHHLFFDGTVRLGHGSFQRSAVDRLTGEPAATGGPGSTQSLLEAFPQFFLGFSSDLGSESVVVAVYACTPVARRLSLLSGDGWTPDSSSLRPRSDDDRDEILSELFDPNAQGAAGFQATDLTLYHMYITAAASYQVVDELVIGVSASYVFGALDLAFVRDAALEGGSRMDSNKGEYVALDNCGKENASDTQATPCNYENAAAAEAMRISGTSHSVAFAAGVLVRPHADVDVGVGYVSKVYGSGGERVEADGDAWVLRSLAAWRNSGGTGYRDQFGRSTVTYTLPQRVHAGVTWRVTPSTALNLQFRWSHLSSHDRLTIRLTGTEFREDPRVPDRILHYRGFQDVFAAQVGGAFRVHRKLVLQVAAMLESSAVASDAVTVTTVDAFKVDALVGLHWRISSSLALRAGYGAVLMPGPDVQQSAFSPSLMTRCVDNRYNVDLADCKASTEGRGMPSAAGQYSWINHRLGVGISYDVW